MDGMSRLDCSYDENINLRKFWWVKFVEEACLCHWNAGCSANFDTM